ncbi:phosphotransferase [Alicyclobacillus sp. SO9]|nr:phosphotransferase [Alicyclobacillus sp. SO9]
MTETESLLRLLESHYGLTAVKVIPMKTVSGIVCDDDSRWIWKEARARDTEQRFHAMNKIQALLGESGISCAAPVSNGTGLYLSTIENGEKKGYLQPWLAGHHVQLENRQERLAAFATVGVMHQLGQYVSSDIRSVLATASLESRLVRKYRAMTEAWNVAIHKLPELRAMEIHVFRSMSRVLEGLSRQPLTGKSTFCHRDLAPHNLLFSGDGQPHISLIDLDQAGYDLPFLDLLQLCNHSLHFSDLRPGDFRESLAVYNRNAPMGPEQRVWMSELLWFPDLLIRTTVEWVAYGCPEQGRDRVWTAATKERLRLRLLAEENVVSG